MCSVFTSANALTWYDGIHPVTYTVVGKTDKVVDTALKMFAEDMVAVTGKEPRSDKKGMIEIYQLNEITSKALKQLNKMGVVSQKLILNKDAFYLGVHDGRIILVGNNGRGVAYGLLELSRMAGVSPWTWWADVKPKAKESLTVKDDMKMLQSPSVEYRGIFINDEDWSMLQWANKTVEPKLPKGSIGPKTYERIFQLLLRLRANTLWPAMHEVTTAFFKVHGNREMAEQYGIVLGSSHCEPLLRNNVGEWDKKKLGDYNFITNRHNVENYWAERLEEMKNQEALFTIGMRGIHDGSMEGVKTADEKLNGLQSVIDSQRQLIKKHYNANVEEVPQVFIPYKEVLDIYERGLKVPEDVTLMWCDDNYGYMTRLSDKEQQKRKGGAGVYYHLSYWGRPHSYLWLSTTQPGLVYNELKQAYDHNARKMWIINVHDPKVAAYDLSLAMDMAWNINSVKADGIRQHLMNWLSQQLGAKTAKAVFPVMEKYYQLTGMRKPEFMGWTQIELDKKKYPGGKSLPQGTEFDEDEFGDELTRYLEQYDALVRVVRAQKRNDATFFAHVQYPIECAAAMAHKQLDAQIGDTLSALAYQDTIRILTKRYNSIAGGKWKGLMDAKPQQLPVFTDFVSTDSSYVRHSKSRPLTEAMLDDCIVRNAYSYDASNFLDKATGKPTTKAGGGIIEMLGHSMRAVSIPKNGQLSYTFTTAKSGPAVIRTALIPTQANDKGDIRYAVSIDGGKPVVYSLKEPFRSEQWKKNVLRGQAVRTTEVNMTSGTHTITITALDDHIIFDQWMLDYKPNRQFYLFPMGR